MTPTHVDQHPAVIETLTVHNVHRRATSLFAEAAASAPTDELIAFRQFVVGMLDHHHHSEDTDLWPLLTDTDPSLGEPLAGLSEEHHVLEAALDDLNNIPIGADDRDSLRQGASDLRDLVHDHLAHEEPILFPALAAFVSAEMWDQFSQRTVATSPPDGNHLIVGLLDEVGTPEQVELVLRHIPPAARDQLPDMRARAGRTLAALTSHWRR